MSVFDGMAVLVTDVTGALFGDLCTWIKGEDTYTGMVKFHDEPGSATLGNVKYGVDNWWIEIKDSDFPGLKTSVNAQVKENVTINVRGVDKTYVCLTADSLSDGVCSMIKLRAKQ